MPDVLSINLAPLSFDLFLNGTHVAFAEWSAMPKISLFCSHQLSHYYVYVAHFPK
jgi:hypothetical protein